MNTDEEQIGSMTMTWAVSQVPIKSILQCGIAEGWQKPQIHGDMSLEKAVRLDGISMGLPYGSNGYLKK